MARRHWLLDSGPSGAYFQGQCHPWKWYSFSLVGGSFGSVGLVFPEMQALAEYCRGTGSWLLFLTSGPYLEGQDFSLKGMCSRGGHWILASGPTFDRTVDNEDAKYVDTGALGRRVTRTANVTIRPMGLMISLSLPRSSRPTKRKAGRYSQLYWRATVDGTKYLTLIVSVISISIAQTRWRFVADDWWNLRSGRRIVWHMVLAGYRGQ